MVYTPPLSSVVDFVIPDVYSPPGSNAVDFTMAANIIVDPTTVISAHLDEFYGIGINKEIAFIDEKYSALTDVLKWFDEIYHIPISVMSFVNLIYGVRLGAHFNEYYGNSPVITKFVNEFYGNNPELRKFLNEFYGNPRELLAYVDEGFNLVEGLEAFMDLVYTIAEKTVQQQTELLYEMQLTNPAMTWEDLIYAINGDTVIEENDLIVTLDGTRVYPFHVNFEFNRDSYKAFAEIHLADQESYLLAIENQTVLRIQDGVDDLSFQVEVPRELAVIGETTYMVPAESHSRILERTARITREFGSGMASVIAAELGAEYGVAVEWLAYDWLIKANTLYANDETPYAVIKKLSDAILARMQPTASGGIVVVDNMEYDTTEWDTAPPSYYLTDQRNFFQTSESVEERDGYNKYRISDHSQTEKRGWLEFENIDSFTRSIKGFKLPYTGEDLVLEHHGNSWVSIENSGWIVKEITEVDVIVVNGAGTLANPIYDLVSVSYNKAVLGSILFSEDGAFTTEVPKHSLVTITYLTKYWLWKATDPNIENVLFTLED